MDVKLGFNPLAELNTWSQVSTLHISQYFTSLPTTSLYWTYSIWILSDKCTKFKAWPPLSPVKFKWIDSSFLTLISLLLCNPTHISLWLMGYMNFADQYFLINVAKLPCGPWKRAMIAGLGGNWEKKQICFSASVPESLRKDRDSQGKKCIDR